MISGSLFLAGSAALALSAAGAPPSHEPPTPPDLVSASRELSGERWGIEDLTLVRSGRVALIDADPPQLDIHLLSLSTPPSPSPSRESSAPPVQDGCFQLQSFDSPGPNALGGGFGVFQRAPSSAAAEVSMSEDGFPSLNLGFERASEGFSGLWMHLYASASPPSGRELLDASSLPFLVYSVRGAGGGERITLEANDAVAESSEIPIVLGDLGPTLPSGRIEPSWQQGSIDLSGVDDLDLSALVSLVFKPEADQRSSISLGGLAFCQDPEATAAIQLVPEAQDELPRWNGSIALWVWDTVDIAENERLREELFQVTRRWNADRIYLQIPAQPRNGETPRAYRRRLRRAMKTVRPLIAALHREGIAVEALDGDARYALAEWHSEVVSALDTLLRLDEALPRPERFDAIHYDVEPYLLEGFGGPRREELLVNYLDLMAKLSSRSHESGIPIEADLPFWYDESDESTGLPLAVTFRGERRGVVDHIYNLVDHVTLMDYRTTAGGLDGTIAHAEGELRSAEAAGKTLRIGLETHPLPAETYLSFSGEPRPWPACRDAASPGGVLLLVQAPQAAAAELRYIPPAEVAEFESPPDAICWSVPRAIPVFPSRLTFAELPDSQLRQVLDATGNALKDRRAMAGFAIHHFGSLRTRTH